LNREWTRRNTNEREEGDRGLLIADEEALRVREVRHSCRTLWKKQLLI
jgi:hypothetical protein